MRIIHRLHEQREFPQKKTVYLSLKKGTAIETLLWDKKTEKVDIKERLVLQDFAWSAKNGHEFLDMEFEKVNLDDYQKEVDGLVKKIMEKHFEVLKYTFMKQMIDRAGRMVDEGCLLMPNIRGIEKNDKQKAGEGTQKVYAI